MKKLLGLFLASILVISAIGCKSAETTESTGGETGAATNAPVNPDSPAAANPTEGEAAAQPPSTSGGGPNTSGG